MAYHHVSRIRRGSAPERRAASDIFSIGTAAGTGGVRPSNGDVFDAVVIGSGPGGSACARTLALDKRKLRVCVLERGERIPFTALCGEYSGCAIVCRGLNLKKVRANNESLYTRCFPLAGESVAHALGGGSAINFSVFVTPCKADLKKAFPSSMRTEELTNEFLDTIVHQMTNEQTFTNTELQTRMAKALRPQQMQREDHDERTKTLWNDHSEHLTWFRTMRNDLAERANAWELLVESLPPDAVTTLSRWNAYRIALRDGSWSVTSRDGREVRAKMVFVACGAIETPALLKRSFGDTLSANIGEHLMNHEQTSIAMPVSTSVSNPSSSSRTMHPMRFIDGGIYGTSSVEFIEASTNFAMSTRLLNIMTPRGALRYCLPTSTAACCCWPLYNDMRMQVFRDTKNNGSVKLKNDEPYVLAPVASDKMKQLALAHKDRTTRRLRVVEGLHPDAGLEMSTVGSWHYAGTARAPATDAFPNDSGTDASSHVLDSTGERLLKGNHDGIFVSDASLPRCTSMGNTMGISAYAGFVSAKQALLNLSK